MQSIHTEMDVIYKRYYQDVFRFCRKLVGQDEYLAEELTQDTFFKAIQAADRFRGDCDIKSWLCQIAKNNYISLLRREKHLSKSEATEQVLEMVPDTKESVHKKAEDAESVQEILDILDDVDEPYQSVFRMKVLQEKEYKEIAEIYHKTESWARVTYYRAKQKIVDEMRQRKLV